MKALLRSKRGLIVVLILFLALGVGAVFYFFDKDKDAKVIEDGVYNSNREESFKSQTNTPEGKRLYINHLEGDGRYEEAKKVAEELVNETKSSSDAMLLMNICNKYIKDGKEQCVMLAQKIISEDVSQLGFFQAYSSAEVFEKNGNKAGAKKLYERAYEVYPPQSQIGELPIKSKEDLKKHIDSL